MDVVNRRFSLKKSVPNNTVAFIFFLVWHDELFKVFGETAKLRISGPELQIRNAKTIFMRTKKFLIADFFWYPIIYSSDFN